MVHGEPEKQLAQALGAQDIADRDIDTELQIIQQMADAPVSVFGFCSFEIGHALGVGQPVPQADPGFHVFRPRESPVQRFDGEHAFEKIIL